ncbi:hypothetical protein M9X92_007979 [Pyricularia oryzae]|nr:hypothetical protein M9X92_007979 [Pyricularia oryzae]
MVSRKVLSAVALFSTLALAQNNNNNNNGQNNNNNNNGGDATQLAPNAVQSGSFFDGSDAIGANDAQAQSDVSQNNFINFCAGQTLTNGLQLVDGSCNGIPMGQIPSKQNMVASVIINPKMGDNIPEGQDFQIQVQTINLQAGSFTNAVATYYTAPQKLNGQGQIIGHTHVTVQDLGNSLNPTQPPDPTQFAFFKGIDDAGNGQGLLAATVEGGLPAGNYRVCTLTSGSNHQPVIMPVAQRGSQDDCQKFTVTANGQGNNNGQNNNGQNNNGQNNNGQNNNGQNNGGQNNGGQNNGGQNNGGQNNGGQNNGGQNNGGQNNGGQNNGGNFGGNFGKNNFRNRRQRNRRQDVSENVPRAFRNFMA